ncbi:MAG TPA: hypothetical protein VMB03_25575 [Bryobacteraceae bacterium]|nr:hypothetical protein [Bryobacteraceae bacterium]
MMRLTVAAAAFMAAAGVASAQNMEAKIPFAFRASGKVFAAGTYELRMHSTPTGSKTLVIQDARGHNDLLTVAYPNGEPKAAWKSVGNAVLSFRCGVSRCVFTTIWTGGHDSVYRLPAPGLGKDEPARTAEIVLHFPKAD